MTKHKFRFDGLDSDTVVKYGVCILSLVLVVILILILSKVDKKSGNNNGNLLEIAKLIGYPTGPNQLQGISVSLSADGNTLAVGGTGDNSFTGATWVFTRTGSTWLQQAKIVAVPAVAGQYQGTSVSLSADGNTLAVSGSSDSNNTGATWIFTRTGSTWLQQAKIVAVPAVAGQYQGTSVSLSADGNTLAVGGNGDTSATGATWIWTRSGSTWTQQAKLVGTSAVSTVSLSANGNTLAIGCISDSANIGATWIWTRSSSNWTQQAKLICTPVTSEPLQNSSVSLSADGNTLAIGGIGNASNTGATWIWSRIDSIWVQQSKLVCTPTVVGQLQGSSVSLSADGNTLAVGCLGDASDTGATWMWKRIGGIWTQGSKLVGTIAVVGQQQGYSVSLSASGNTLAVGGATDSNKTGATWIFN